jgi:hypothetical protein
MCRRLPDDATGKQLVAAIETEARRRGVSRFHFVGPLTRQPRKWLQQVAQAKRPKPATIERVRALLSDETVPAAPLNNFQAPKVVPNEPPAAPSPRPAIPAVPYVDREPCWRCGTRGDIGCRHRLRA